MIAIPRTSGGDLLGPGLDVKFSFTASDGTAGLVQDLGDGRYKVVFTTGTGPDSTTAAASFNGSGNFAVSGSNTISW